MDWFPYVFGFVVVVGGGLTFIWWRSVYGVGIKDDKIDAPRQEQVLRKDPYNRQEADAGDGARNGPGSPQT